MSEESSLKSSFSIPQRLDQPSTEIRNFFLNIFDVPPCTAQLEDEVFWIVRDLQSNSIIGAIAAVFQRYGQSDYQECYTLQVGISSECRGQEIGSSLLKAMEQEARQRECIQVRMRTFQDWNLVLDLIEKHGWLRSKARPSERYNFVEEDWILPLPKRPIQVILVGANPNGRGGEWAKAIERQSQLASLTGVVDCSQESLKHWEAKGLPAAADIDDLLEKLDTKPDAAVLALPHSEYSRAREACFRHKLAMLHEKPLGTSLQELIELKEKLETTPVPLIVGVQRRAHPAYIYLHHIVTEKMNDRLPETVYVRLALGHSPSPSPPKEQDLQGAGKRWRDDPRQARGGGLIDLGYHAIDLVHFILDSPLDVTFCSLWKGDSPAFSDEIDDRAVIVGRCGSAWVRIDVDRFGASKEEYMILNFPNMQIRATRDSVEVDGKEQYSCKKSWIKAEEGVVARLAIAPGEPDSLEFWNYYAVMRVIESAKGLAAKAGFKREDFENE